MGSIGISAVMVERYGKQIRDAFLGSIWIRGLALLLFLFFGFKGKEK
jgi:hypothetical protein